MNEIKASDTIKECKVFVGKITERVEQGVIKAVIEVKRSMI